MDSDKWEILFFKVWSNIYIFKNIIEQLKLLIKNDVVEFNDLKSLNEYNEKDYINTLIYKGCEMLTNNNLPNGGYLKVVNLTGFIKSSFSNSPIVKPGHQVIPNGVEKVIYSTCFDLNKYQSLSTLPKSVTIVENVTNELLLQNNKTGTGSKYFIPNQIKSISFYFCPRISNDSLIIPNTIETLQFGIMEDDNQILNIGDIPNSVKKLSISKESSCVFLPIKENGIIPFSITNLSINFKFLNDLKFLFSGYSNLKKLKLISYNESFEKLEYGIIPLSITKLTLVNIFSNDNFTRTSIPSSVTRLSLKGSNLLLKGCKSYFPSSITFLKINGICIFEHDSIPNSITYLKISIVYHSTIHKSRILPESLTCIEFDKHYYRENNISNILSIFQNLPKSIKKIILPNNNNNNNNISTVLGKYYNPNIIFFKNRKEL